MAGIKCEMMKKLIVVLIIFGLSCKTQPHSSSYYQDNDPKKIYHLRLSPAVGSKYAYTTTKESEFTFQGNGKTINNKSRAVIGLVYTIGRDSVGNVLLNITYEKVHLYAKNDEKETQIDADNAETSIDPVERMLGVLKGSALQVAVSSSGAIVYMHGDQVIKEKIMAAFSPGDTYTKMMAGKQWDERIKENLIRNNVEQLFNIFPDSAVHVGNRWKLGSTQKDQIVLNFKTSYLLKEIIDGTAVILADGDISGEDSTVQWNGTTFTSDLKGKQEGEFEMETATGMLLRSHIDSKISGSMTMMGRQIPVTIGITVKIQGEKVR
jgi:hypothetical protein